MRLGRLLIVSTVAWAAMLVFVPEAHAVSPQNPYRSFNLSGVNYGSMQWDRAQRQGKRVWPYYNTPNRSSSRGESVAVGGVGGGGAAIVSSNSSRSSSRRFRRR